ncbi:hypothetical protein AUR64_15195 [Haloprofundus marisrubri]|uniref:DUF7991 domain-containing protein n=1 Tax=Haloprofundus marisrubri TaxID=1514971 RepID=A0A0W1R861_9EURY|nr:hypothetical protein [Haloprofundus marisrubri]KTG09560.1 hypothetical protein AUR64_15195 [Haloprofundus marisrubri]
MVSVLGLVVLGVAFVAHTAVAAVMTRFLRLRLDTQWGMVLYAVILIPFVLLVLTLVTGQLVPVELGQMGTLGLLVGMPLALGFTIDVLYMPAPEEYELPDAR